MYGLARVLGRPVSLGAIFGVLEDGGYSVPRAHELRCLGQMAICPCGSVVVDLKLYCNTWL
jgi:hypothetical protein